MERLFSKRNLPVLVLNVSTILIVAIMLVFNQALAKSNQSSTAGMLNSGMLSYQGTLMDVGGNPKTGAFDFVFRIYDSPTAIVPLWEEAHTGANAVPVQNGLFNVLLGSLNPIADTVWEGSELFLGVKIGSDAEMSPREKLTVVTIASMALNIPDGIVTQDKAPFLLKSPDSYQRYEVGTVALSLSPGWNSHVLVSTFLTPYQTKPVVAVANISDTQADHGINILPTLSVSGISWSVWSGHTTGTRDIVVSWIVVGR